jgi:hypothetical protein
MLNRSILTLRISDEKQEFYVCGCYNCIGGLSDIAYSHYHAGELGWRTMQFTEEECFVTCPACVKRLSEANEGKQGVET